MFGLVGSCIVWKSKERLRIGFGGIGKWLSTTIKLTTTGTAGDGTAHTWRGLKADESFWPGRLDLFSTTGFESVNGRVFDAGRLTESELKQHSVEKADSLASDHLMLVVDCKSEADSQ